MQWLASVASYLAPVLLFLGALLCWFRAREPAALVMALGLLPTLVSVGSVWWLSRYIMRPQSSPIEPGDSMFKIQILIAHWSSVGMLISSIAFGVLVWRLSRYAGRGQ
ncbi:MAG: hypothetical protein AAGA91_14910 [Pseudomonadota bacterium]